MPVSFRRLNKGQGTKVLTIPYGDDNLNITYNRAKYTPKLERELQQKVESQSLIGGLFSGYLNNLLISWDAMDVHPEDLEKAEVLENDPNNPPGIEDYKKAGIRLVPVPLNEETFDSLLSIEAQSDLVTALANDQRPNQSPSDFTSNS